MKGREPQQKTKAIIFASVPLLATLLSAIALRTAIVQADSVDKLTVTLSDSCSMTGSGTSSHTESIVNGQYDSTIGETTINVTCNDGAGFAVYAIGYTNNMLGNNVLTSATAGSSNDIATGTLTSGNDSQWAMKLGPDTAQSPSYPTIIAGSSSDSDTDNTTDYSAFQQVPSSYAKVAYRTAGTDVSTNAEGSTFTTTYQAYISSTQPTGTYEGKVKYVLVHPSTAGRPFGYCNTESTCLQTATSSSLAAQLPNVGDTATLKDSRDGTSYTVGKLADGSYWILDNLALDITNSTILNGLDVTNTNASNATLAYLKGTNTRDPSNDPTGAYATAAASSTWTSNTYSAPLANLASKNTVPSDATSTAGSYKVGGYYNYCAATAGSYCYGDGGSEGTSSSNATEDICPKGWRMPTGGDSGEYKSLFLNASYGTYSSFRAALHLPLSGDFSAGANANQGSLGFFWSSTRDDDVNMYSLVLDTSNAGPVGYYDRSFGYSIRCLLK